MLMSDATPLPPQVLRVVCYALILRFLAHKLYDKVVAVPREVSGVG